MALHAGQVMNNGVIAGSGGVSQRGLAVLDEVVAALTTHHGMLASLKPRTGGVFGPYEHGEASKWLKGGRQGVVVRVTKGRGKLEVGFANIPLRYGDWAYIPPGADFRVVSTSLLGTYLWVAIAQLEKG